MNDATATSAYGVDSMVAPLGRVAMRAPGPALLGADPHRWHYTKPLDPPALLAQYEAFTALVEASGAEIVWFDEPSGGGLDDELADSVFTFDPSFLIADGAIVLRPGKELRAGEAELHAEFYRRIGVPVIGTIEAPGRMEGGDLCWLDSSTLAVGRGFRTDQAGIDQLADILTATGVELEAFDLPYGNGPDACLHLLSLVSPLADDLALVHEALLPVRLHGLMRELGYTLLSAPVEEFAASGGLSLNVLATGPREVIAVDGFPETAALLRDGGCNVALFAGDELCIPCEGGPTCLTRPLLRS